ncbi:hypothetical protein CEXT_321951 [Caerostris extrusa]|uniref:Uncharacterized protein n=1 Tax=Caerostris extrusa TaxID=172846 RepID=A0AAV4QJZ2_CAEEX|nr:hypothetical protein CEXT_321951 [Caerostris extrusa]
MRANHSQVFSIHRVRRPGRASSSCLARWKAWLESTKKLQVGRIESSEEVHTGYSEQRGSNPLKICMGKEECDRKRKAETSLTNGKKMSSIYNES